MKKLKLLFVFVLNIYATRAQVTIENLLSVPFPTDLKSSPDLKHVAWVFNDKGVRNIFIADAPEFFPRMLTHHREDDGLEITNLVFSTDGRQLFFTEGNSLNGSGEAANPAFLQNKSGQFVWQCTTDGSSLHKVAAGDYPSISPDGTMLVFVSGGKIWSYIPADTAKPAQVLYEGRGNVSDIRWAPDSKKIAFISRRNDHAFLGIFTLADKMVQYPDPSVDVDMAPVWSPDAKWIAYIRVPGRKDLLPFTDLRKGQPWSIRLLDIPRIKAKELWKADEGRGSILFTGIPIAENILLWSNKNQLVFPWEKDGWQHLYALDVFEKAVPRLLTPGDGEVETMVLSADKASIIYNSNINDSHRRHISKVDISSGENSAITTGTGIEWSPVQAANGIIVLRSTATSPGWPVLVQGNNSFRPIGMELFPSDFPGKLLVVPQVVSFRSSDGILIHGQLFLPPGYDKNKKYPALLFFHGGSRRQMLVGFHYMGYYSHDYAMNQYYASRGYLVLAVNYRSGIGYGMEFREALHYGANGASEYGDVIAAGLYMQKRQDVDKKRIGLWGGSYGGFLTAMGLSRNSNVFACGVDIHGVHDWNEELKNWAADYDPARRAAFAAIANKSSPVHFIKGWRSPVLLIHGDDDRNVPFNQTVDLVEKLREQHVYFEQLVLPDEIHDFLLHKNWLSGYHAAENFFARQMK